MRRAEGAPPFRSLFEGFTHAEGVHCVSRMFSPATVERGSDKQSYDHNTISENRHQSPRFGAPPESGTVGCRLSRHEYLHHCPDFKERSNDPNSPTVREQPPERGDPSVHRCERHLKVCSTRAPEASSPRLPPQEPDQRRHRNRRITTERNLLSDGHITTRQRLQLFP